ncbi:RagB/SusD family nutrient uptake outer membrane protein [Rufibacter sediminis]|uniref:RagB/SusD family nutrient uptake outer membrane protein n=1 Tax=Rufibacter sediminis TaxID=2762756 RepID=A0ABR6VPV6_9BACT|nr:RagB/SusD family nutrient uptake outer membrane protein [Rufibacter sediminis]MBC3539218.1 RagB/SusD family nutrient uptake outer membrane protein [Rufibacter sediminis]
MKTRSIYTSALAILLALSSTNCTQLEDESFTEILSSEFDPKASDVAALVGRAYTNMRFILLDWDGTWRAQEVSADQIVIPARPNGWVDGGVFRRLHEHKWTTDDPIVIQTWNRTFAGITNTNRLLYQIETGLVPLATEKEATIAELKVLRAYYYYLLCDMYGNVPIVTSFDLPEGFLPEQSTRKQVYEFIVKELKDNIPLLSTKNDISTYGRFNKWAGLTLLAKMYLNAQVYSGTPAWQECVNTCDEIINGGAGFILESNHKDVFRTSNEGSKEIIFGIPIDEKYTTNWNAFDFHLQTLAPESQATYNLKSTPWGGMAAIPQFVSSYDPDDIRLKTDWIQGQQYTAAGQPIIAGGTPLIYVNEIAGVDRSNMFDGFRLGKFEIKPESTNILNNDFPLLRYSDVLFMKAESLLRTGRADEAAAIVTQIRQRYFKSNPAKAVVTGAELMQGSTYDYGLRNHTTSTDEEGRDIMYGRMLDELGWEFSQEGRRRQDMIRFNVFTKKSWFSHTPNSEYRSLYPIPRVELQKNTKLVQNPGYPQG